jgi:radical SAM protein with 4Fe4S-binding SPASM domain
MQYYNAQGGKAANEVTAEGIAQNAGNIDSYAAANALRQQLDFTNAGNQAVLNQFNAQSGKMLDTLRALGVDVGDAQDRLMGILGGNQAYNAELAGQYNDGTAEILGLINQNALAGNTAAVDALQKAGVHVRIATPFMRENKDCVEELKSFAVARNVHLVADAEIFGQLDHSCENQSHALSFVELEGLVSEHKNVFMKGCMEAEKCAPDAKVCDVGEARLNLDAEGMYYPCDGFHGAILGDARTETIMEVWNGAALNKLRALKNRDFGECASCADRAWCKVCPMRNFNETGDMFTHAPWRCEATRIYKRIFEER